jgi:hypothetical protein
MFRDRVRIPIRADRVLLEVNFATFSFLGRSSCTLCTGRLDAFKMGT